MKKFILIYVTVLFSITLAAALFTGMLLVLIKLFLMTGIHPLWGVVGLFILLISLYITLDTLEDSDKNGWWW